MKKITIAIDGFSSSGKSTMAKQLAKKIGYVYVDSGAMYRATTLYAIRHGMTDKETGVNTEALIKALPLINISFAITPEETQHTILNGEDVEKEIRGMEVSGWVSPVAVIPEVRHYLVKLQQQYGKDKGIVMDGRDIGTTVFPDAEMKVFVNASPEVRAKRRYDELIEKGTPSDFESVLANIKERDHIDSTREESPLRKADDAFVLDNDNLTREEQMEVLVNLFEEKTRG
ncbi:MAG: (d)CMP kinase [Muribaculaceae bacterium]|nr:(d)CMP kinase [Muribaculaceae bacterium]MDE6523176.1 (d)CMP kinase [Muribaculaceae bacterium]